MKVLLLVAALFAVSMGQTDNPLTCIGNMAAELAQSVSSECLTMFSSLSATGTPTADQLNSFCPSSCAGSLNNAIVDLCGSNLLSIYCSTDDSSSPSGYCLPRASDIGVMLGTVIATSCLGVDCSDATCNSAVQGLSCCGESALSLAGGASTLLPDGCSITACGDTIPDTTSAPVTTVSPTAGAADFVAMPLAIFSAIFVAVAAFM